MKLTGKLLTGDTCRCSDDLHCGAVFINNTDLLEAIDDEFAGTDTVTATITCDKGSFSFTGKVSTSFGWGYSEWTPMESDEALVGNNDIVRLILDKCGDGDHITVEMEKVE